MKATLLFISLALGSTSSEVSHSPASVPISETQATALVTPETAGFEDAYFSRSGLQGMLSHPEATGIRFYNVKINSTDTQGTVMAIAVRADDSEIDGGATSRRYVRSDGYSGSGIRSTDLSCADAEAHCANMTASGLTSFSSTFTRAEIQALTAAHMANTLRVTPGEVSGNGAMMLESVSVIRGVVTDLGSGAGFDLLDGDPCPIACGVGQEGNYINR